MTRIAIVTDSSADLASHVAAAGGITVVPMAISLGADSIRRGTASPGNVDPGELPGVEPRTDMVEAFTTAFSHLAETHDAVVAVLLSARLGGSVAAASRAGALVERTVPVTVIDSRSVSMGLGFQVLHAAEMARQGAATEAIAAALRAATDRRHVVFSVESVEHLRQSGQIGRSAAMIAEALHLKPLLRIDEGQIVPYERARTRTRAIAELAHFVREFPAVERCAVLHATSLTDANRLLRAIAADTGLPPDRLTVHQIGEAVAARVGPGALGVVVVEADAE